MGGEHAMAECYWPAAAETSASCSCWLLPVRLPAEDRIQLPDLPAFNWRSSWAISFYVHHRSFLNLRLRLIPVMRRQRRATMLGDSWDGRHRNGPNPRAELKMPFYAAGGQRDHWLLGLRCIHRRSWRSARKSAPVVAVASAAWRHATATSAICSRARLRPVPCRLATAVAAGELSAHGVIQRQVLTCGACPPACCAGHSC